MITKTLVLEAMILSVNFIVPEHEKVGLVN